MENRKEWFRLLEQCGITRLENEFVTLSRGEDTIVLAGVDDPNGPRDQKTPEELLGEIHAENPDAYTIVLCHRNDQLERMARLKADLVLSGHAHGGVVRLPIVGAVFGTHYEFFPDYTSGSGEPASWSAAVSAAAAAFPCASETGQKSPSSPSVGREQTLQTKKNGATIKPPIFGNALKIA